MRATSSRMRLFKRKKRKPRKVVKTGERRRTTHSPSSVTRWPGWGQTCKNRLRSDEKEHPKFDNKNKLTAVSRCGEIKIRYSGQKQKKQAFISVNPKNMIWEEFTEFQKSVIDAVNTIDYDSRRPRGDMKSIVIFAF